VPNEQVALIIAVLVAGTLAGAWLVLNRRRPGAAYEHDRDADTPIATDRAAADKYALAEPSLHAEAATGARGGGGAYVRAVRIAWWVSIASVLVGVGLSGAFEENQPYIYLVGAAGVVTVIGLHELMPASWRVPGRFWVEATIALALVTALVALTGYGGSPFWVGYPLVTVAIALAQRRAAALTFALLSTGAIAAATWIDPAAAGIGGPQLIMLGSQVGATWLLTALAAVYAAQERRVRATFLELSLTDPLTGLFNRSQIFATLDQEIRRTRRSERGFCVLMIDLDGLKAVNDTLGHHRGDEVLRHLGAVIRRSIRTVDTAYRFGGDEFVVLLPETDIVGAFVVAEKIRSGLEEVGLTLGLEGIEPSVSIGLVSHPEDGGTVEELMIAADRAMYQAKSLGKNQISGYPRPRRVLPSLPVAPPPIEAPAAEPDPAPMPEAAPAPNPARSDVAAATDASAPPKADSSRATGATGQLHPVEMDTAPLTRNGSGADGGDDEPDAGEVRRQIAAASRSFDPDHQIRRAMDAFLGPIPTEPRERQ
jgi:diguanylate cyclase (GGDEF)-like protein